MARQFRGRKFLKTELEGVDDLEAAIKRLSEDTQGRVLRDATEAGAEIPRSVASQLAPRSTEGSHGREPGFLAENILAEVQFTRTQDTARVHVGMHADAWYGRFQETGTQFQPAQPFLRPALDATKDDVVDVIRDHLAASILKSL